MKVSKRFAAPAFFAFCAMLFLLFSSGSVTHAHARVNESVLYSYPCSEFEFGCGQEGPGPLGPLIRDSVGNLYGTTSTGNNVGCSTQIGCGNVYELSPDGSGGWTQKILYTFAGGTDGINPVSGVIMDSSGDLYGVTEWGGGGSCNANYGCGTVFKLTKSGSAWTESVIATFGGTFEAFPQGTLTFDKKGNIYGATSGATANCPNFSACGTVFVLSPSSNGWQQTVLYSFRDAPDISVPNGPLIFGPDGSLYGVGYGGAYGAGGVFRLTPSSGKWKETVIWNFTGGVDGDLPNGILFYQGELYGTTLYQGSFNAGTIFKLTPSVGSWSFTLMYNFTGGNDGGHPSAGFIKAGGKFYGATSLGGLYQYGTVYQLTPLSNGAFAEDVAYNFTGGTDGGNPNNQLVAGPNELFGTTVNLTEAVIYKISKD